MAGTTASKILFPMTESMGQMGHGISKYFKRFESRDGSDESDEKEDYVIENSKKISNNSMGDKSAADEVKNLEIKG